MSEQNSKPCECIKTAKVKGYFYVNCGLYHNLQDWSFCPICGSAIQELKNQDDLDMIFEKHDHKYDSRKKWFEAIKNDLKEWNENEIGKIASGSTKFCRDNPDSFRFYQCSNGHEWKKIE